MTESSPPHSTGPARPAVLVVDDTMANLKALEALLGSLDLDVTPAMSGEEALKHLLQRDFALVLMDVQMPGLDGFATTRLIRARDRTRYTPIIFVTAIYTDEQSAQQAYALGAIDYVTKPFDDRILKAKIAALVNHYRHIEIINRQADTLRAQQTQLDEVTRAKDEFLAMLSHELRSPLNAVLGWSSVLESDANLSPRLAAAAQAIARNARAQSRLIDDLLDLSLLTAQQLRLEPRAVELERLAQSVLASAQPLAAAKRVHLRLASDGTAAWTMADRARLEQALGHLVSNAIKFSHDGDPVQVKLERHDGSFRFVVEDVGLGIGPDILPHVFERFRQGDSSRTRRHGGLGIGLTLARLIAELHGGTLEAFSAGEGAGAAFALTIPAHPVELPVGESRAPSAPGPAAPTVDHPLRGVELLLVDDDADVRYLLSTTLADAGAIVVEAASAAEALQLFSARPFNVLISDLGMPEENGLSLLGKVRAQENGTNTPVIAVALTGYGSADDREQTVRAGFQAHVVKPCTPATLIALLSRLLAASGRARAGE
jgi:signal transduction histidine kinase